MYSNISGTWKKVSKVFNNVSGTWREVKKAFTNVGGTWKQVHSGAAEFTFATNQAWNRAITMADMYDATTIANNTDFVITVNAGVTIQPTVDTYAFDFSGVSGKTITIVNNGTIKGGNGVTTIYYPNLYSMGCGRYNYLSPLSTNSMLTDGQVVGSYGVYGRCNPGYQFWWKTTLPNYSWNGCQGVFTWAVASASPTGGKTNLFGSNTVSISGNAVIAGDVGAIKYMVDTGQGNCNCDCIGGSG